VHKRLNQNDVTNKINVEDPHQVRDAVLALLTARYPGADLAPLRRAFDDIKALFAGRFPGYLPCDTLYHDLRHTLDMTLAMARLLDGHDRALAAADQIGARRAMLGVGSPCCTTPATSSAPQRPTSRTAPSSPRSM
jgi:hypothetical protein